MFFVFGFLFVCQSEQIFFFTVQSFNENKGVPLLKKNVGPVDFCKYYSHSLSLYGRALIGFYNLITNPLMIKVNSIIAMFLCDLQTENF